MVIVKAFTFIIATQLGKVASVSVNRAISNRESFNAKEIYTFRCKYNILSRTKTICEIFSVPRYLILKETIFNQTIFMIHTRPLTL